MHLQQLKGMQSSKLGTHVCERDANCQLQVCERGTFSVKNCI